MEQIKKIEYDTPFEVTKDEYYHLMAKCATFVAGQIKEGKHYLKIWFERGYVLDTLNKLRTQN
jgi:hypothetical protein